ncbi:MAG: hypothetical protein U9Q62_09905 [Campylobacterota bacterium]|nr:hypothetical protein [Campylobacterota bacterium]
MLKISESITNLDPNDIADNLLYYDYNVKHLLALKRKGIKEDDNAFISAYRSFEGEVFENFMYEKLLRYASEHSKITEFILKGPHRKREKAIPNNLSVNWKGQIIYRTKRNEIGEFDGLIFADKVLYFVEMTLVKSVSNLKKRLRKKKALLETIYPNYEIKALLILNEGATGVNQLPDYCTVWLTKPYSAKKVYEWMSKTENKKRRRFKRVQAKNLVSAESIKTKPFRYYDTLTWILRKLRTDQKHILNLGFMKSPTFIRYHDLFTKVYLGFMEPKIFQEMVPELDIPDTVKILVALEKEHTGRVVVTYFMQHARKKLDNISISSDGKVSVLRKDPYGVTVTEVVHIIKTMHPTHQLQIKDIETVEKSLSDYKA